MSPDELHPLATLPLLILLVLSPKQANSYAHAESSAPQLYVKDGDAFVKLDGRFAVVPLENVLERKSSGGRRKECIAACLRDRTQSRTGRSLGFDHEAASPVQEQPLEEGVDCVIKTTQVTLHYGQCHDVGGVIPYCISDTRDSSEAPIFDIFSRDCALASAHRSSGWVKAASKKESSNPGIFFADVEALPELAVAHKWLPSHSAAVTSTSDASLPPATTQAEAAVVDEASTAGHRRRDAEQT